MTFPSLFIVIGLFLGGGDGGWGIDIGGDFRQFVEAAVFFLPGVMQRKLKSCLLLLVSIPFQRDNPIVLLLSPISVPIVSV